MTDRELLEAAAKAAGLPYIKPHPNHDGRFGIEIGDHPMRTQNWNPLTDDGDALRLAVAVGVSINVTKTNIIVRCGDFYDAANRNTLRANKANEVAFIRRAIVCAAAAIGRQP